MHRGVLLPGRGKVLEFGKGVNLRRPAAKLSDSLQNTKCCLEVDPSKAQCRGQGGDTLGGRGLEERVWGNTVVWQG